jgi:hypothetical protein
MNQFSHRIYEKVNAPFVKNLPIFIVLTVVMFGYAFTIVNCIRKIIKYLHKYTYIYFGLR